MAAKGHARVCAAANIPISVWTRLIDEWIFSERDRAIMKRRLLDGVVFEQLAEEFEISVRQAKNIVSRCMDILIEHVPR